MNLSRVIVYMIHKGGHSSAVVNTVMSHLTVLGASIIVHIYYCDIKSISILIYMAEHQWLTNLTALAYTLR